MATDDCDVSVSIEKQKSLDVTIDDNETCITNVSGNQQARIDINTAQALSTEINGGVRNVNVPVIEGTVLVDGGLFLGYPVFIQDDEPTETGPYVWVQTNYLEPGGMTVWVNCL